MLNKWFDVYQLDKVINVDQDLIGKPEYEGYNRRKCESGWTRGAQGLDVLTTRQVVLLIRGQRMIAVCI